MASDDQDLLQTLYSLPVQILHYSSELTTSFEKQCDNLGKSIRESLSSSTWIPEQIRPAPAPRPLPVFHVPLSPKSFSHRAYEFLVEYRAAAAAITAFVVTGGALYYRQRRNYLHKRRARRGPDGTKKEVIFVAGNPNAPVALGVALDLERRGFIVQFVVGTSAEVERIERRSKPDLRALLLDVTYPSQVEATMARFASQFNESKDGLHLAGFILIPDPAFTVGPIETVSPEIWSDTFNTKLVHSIATTQAFLRLLISTKSKILILTPTIIPSLRPPFNGPESTIFNALDGFVGTLSAEMHALGVAVTQIKMGNLHVDHFGGNILALQRQRQVNPFEWPDGMRDDYASIYVDSNAPGDRSSTRGSPIRELHNTVFDVLFQQGFPRNTIRVGRGSFLYPAIAFWMPQGLIAWLMGYRR